MQLPEPLELLDTYPGAAIEVRHWNDAMTQSLRDHPDEWLHAVGNPANPAAGALTTGRAWVLLGWAETTIMGLMAERRPDRPHLVAFAFALLEASPLDRRDVIVIAMLLRRACSHKELDFAAAAKTACDAAGPLGERARTWLPTVSGVLPTTYVEVTDGPTVRFERKPSDIDIDRLTRWASGEKVPARQRRTADPGTAPPAAVASHAVEAAHPDPADDVTLWPRPVRYTAAALGAVLLGAGAISFITFLYDRGVMPIAGPFVAAIVAALLIAYVRPLWLRRQVGHAAATLDAVRPLLEAERSRRHADRPSAANTAALDRAIHHAGEAHRRLAWGQEAAAIKHLGRLVDLGATWEPDADLTRTIAPLRKYTDRIARVLPNGT